MYDCYVVDIDDNRIRTAYLPSPSKILTQPHKSMTI